jgi:8-oxo-dGTP pyrophosphatase MutT (NUDIX family)
MVREISAGGIVLRGPGPGWEIAVIEPHREPAVASFLACGKKRAQKVVFALPKGLVDPGEKPDQTAVREVWEETGLRATLLTKLGDIRYVYKRTWGDQQRVFKIVSFYLLRYESGRINDIGEKMRTEVRRALWMPLQEAARKLAYHGEKEMAQRAEDYLKTRREF